MSWNFQKMQPMIPESRLLEDDMNWHMRELMRLQREFNLRRVKEMDMNDYNIMRIGSYLESIKNSLNDIVNVYVNKEEKKENMTFGEALEAMKQGKRVSEPAFCKGIYFGIKQPDVGSDMTFPYTYIHDRNGELMPTTFENEQLLSNKWFIVQ